MRAVLRAVIAWLFDRTLTLSETEINQPSAPVGAFPKSYRLTKTDEYSSVFGFRKALRSQHFLLHYRARNQTDLSNRAEDVGARLGLVVAKRLLRRAVDRNLIRRLARESFRLQRASLPANDLILRLANRPAALDRQLLAIEMRALLEKMANRNR